MQKEKFIKQAVSLDDQILLLRQRGLEIEDPIYAKHCLQTTSFHRLSAYFKPYEENKQTHQFKPHIKFYHVWDLYLFDRELRLLVLDALEKIEISLRTSLSNVMSLRYDPWWYLNPILFKSDWVANQKGYSPFDIFKFELDAVCKHKTPEEEVRNYYKKYSVPDYPPSWIILECLSFGKCTSLFRYLRHHKDKSEVSFVFKQHYKIVESILECLRYTRNLCAHHSRLWDRWFVYKPRELKELKHIDCLPGTLKEQLAVLHLLHQAVSYHSIWKKQLFALFEKYNALPVSFHQTGFHENWAIDLFWKD